MSSAVHYKFRSSKDYRTITFDSDFIVLRELKQAIANQNKLERSELRIVHAQTGEEFTMDSAPIPKNTSVIAIREPAVRLLPLEKTAVAPIISQSEVASVSSIILPPSMTSTDPSIQQSNIQSTDNQLPTAQQNSDEDEKIKLISQQSASGLPEARPMVGKGMMGKGNMMLQQQQQQMMMMGQQQNQMHINAYEQIPPPNYICHRCHQPGHYIKACPTNGDPAFEVQKVRRASGFPLMYLDKIDSNSGPTNTSLLHPTGGMAVIRPNEQAFDALAAKVLLTQYKQNIASGSSSSPKSPTITPQNPTPQQTETKIETPKMPTPPPQAKTETMEPTQNTVAVVENAEVKKEGGIEERKEEKNAEESACVNEPSTPLQPPPVAILEEGEIEESRAKDKNNTLSTQQTTTTTQQQQIENAGINNPNPAQICFACNQPGHFARECPTKVLNNNNNSNNSNNNNNSNNSSSTNPTVPIIPPNPMGTLNPMAAMAAMSMMFNPYAAAAAAMSMSMPMLPNMIPSLLNPPLLPPSLQTNSNSSASNSNQQQKKGWTDKEFLQQLDSQKQARLNSETDRKHGSGSPDRSRRYRDDHDHREGDRHHRRYDERDGESERKRQKRDESHEKRNKEKEREKDKDKERKHTHHHRHHE